MDSDERRSILSRVFKAFAFALLPSSFGALGCSMKLIVMWPPNL